MSENVIEISNLTRRFGSKTALDNVSLSIPAGIVMGLVGENGAGKTTLIKHILGLLKPQDGSVRVFGRNPVTDPEGVLSQIGYLSEEGDLPVWMKVGELMRYAAAFYPNWDDHYAKKLIQEFNLDPEARLSKLSKGQRSRAGLVMAMAYRPQLLLLDEPSSGLDPIVRRDILGAIIRTIADDGRTVLFSSHLLSEVERVSDRIAMMKGGRILLADELNNVKENHLRVTFVYPEALSNAPQLPGCFAWNGKGKEWSATFSGSLDQLEAVMQGTGAQLVEKSHLTLDEIFVSRVGGK